MTTYCVKVRQSGKKSWAFLTSKGGTNRLRIHASEIPDKTRAESIAAEINQENKGVYEAKAEVFSADEPRTTPHYHVSESQAYEGIAENCPYCSPELKAANRITEAQQGSALTPVVAILTVFSVGAVLIAQSGLVNALVARFAQVVR